MNNKKHIIGLEQFRDILQICPKVGNKKFVDPPLETEIIIFLASLGHSGDIRKLSDVNVNKLHQPWRSFAAVINKCLCGTPSYDSLRLSQAQILWGMYNKKNVDYAYLLWEDFIFKIENKSTKKGSAMYYPRFTKIVVNYVMEKDPSIPRRNKVNWHYARDDPMFTTINVISRNEATQLYGAILPVALTNEDIRNSESYKEYYAMASGTIPPKTKGSKKKANTDAIPKLKPPTAPKEKKSGKGKQKTTELENISEADLTEAEQLKIVTKRSRQETHSSHASGSGADEGTGITPGVPDAPDYDSEDDISWKSSDDDQEDDEQADDEDDDEHDDDEKVQDDDDEELTESDNDDDDDDENEGTNVEGEKTQEEATETEDQGNEEVKDSNTDLDGRDKVMTDVEDTHVTLTPVNPDGQQQSSSVSSGVFQTSIMEPSFTAQINRPPTPHPIIIQPQQQPILTPATTTSSSIQNLPNFASLFGFDNRLKALEDNFSELRQTNQYAEALSSIPSTVEQYLANKMQEAVDVAVQLKYERIREESTKKKNTANQQFLDSIDDGMKKIIKEQVKKEVSKIIPKVEKLVTDQLESEVLVRSSKEANTSHAVAANLSELELKKILIDKMEANNSINRSDIQRQLYKDLVEAYEADKILLDTYGDTVSIKRPRDGADDDEEPSAGTDRGSKRSRSGKEPASTSAPSETTTKTAGQPTDTDVSERPADQEFETGVQDEQAEEEVQHLPDWFQKPTRLPSPDHAWNTSVPAVHESVQPWLSNLAQQDPRESFDELTDSTFDSRLRSTSQTEKLELDQPEGRKYPHDLRPATTPKVLYFSTKDKAADYGHIKWIEDLVPNSMWSQTIVKYDKFALWGISHWGKKRRQFYAFATLRESARDVYSKRRIIVVTKFKEGDFYRLRIQDIEDMLLLLVQGKVTNLSIEERIAFNRLHSRDVQLLLMIVSYGIRMEYLPQTFGSQRGQGNQRAMIQAIGQEAKEREDNESLERIWSVTNIRVNSFTMKMEILLESTSNKLMVEHAEYDESNTYVLERFNTSAGNPVKKILLKLNLSDHRLCKMVVEVPDSSWLTRSITTCSYPTDKHKVIMKAQVHVSRLPLL
ncbi:hypothetical protein Tco_0408952 [Tanacetum coccineum]